ncbi:MAG: molybdopterin-binding protein [Armatimonadota bacterium]
MKFRIASVNIAPNKGEGKSPVDSIVLIAGLGVKNDAHVGGERQVSLLAQESINKAIASGVDLGPGDFGENLTVEGIDLLSNGTGWRLLAGKEAILQISEIGKVCHHPCSIGQRLGDCIMPKEGVFAKVIKSGDVYPGDSIKVTPMRVGAVLTSSDRCSTGERQDESGPLLVVLLQDLGIEVVDYAIMPDDENQLSGKLRFLADRRALDIILTTGGTGLSPRDHMPEATQSIIDSFAPGISEAIRQEGMKHTTFACLSRGVSGLRGRTLIINLPGSKRAIEESSTLLRSIIPHTLGILRAEISDCGRGHE